LTDTGYPPSVPDEALRYEYATGLLYVDYGADDSRVAALVQRWYDEGERLSSFAAASRPTTSATEVDADGRVIRTRPGRWADAVNDQLDSLAARWASTAPTTDLTELMLRAEWFGTARRHLRLQASARLRPGVPAETVASALVAAVATVADEADPNYGEVVVNSERRPPSTNLDIALRRAASRSADAARSELRGYEWATVCPAQLVARLGGVEAIAATGAFAEVRALAAGGALLVATKSPADYGPAAAARVFAALAPVLPPGRPRPLPGINLDLVVLREPAG
jgi:hypothetical protein